MRPDHLLITCEHGGRRIPPRYRPLFAGHEGLLATHRAFDFGALQLAREMAEALHAPLYASTTSRLLVDLNRSVGHPGLHSEATRMLPLAERRSIVAGYWQPHRERVHAHVAQAITQGARVVHIAAHSFTPVLDGEVRRADIGLLYDPSRPGEVALASRWLQALRQQRPDLLVRRNYPYAGKDDGLTNYLRRRHADDEYAGIEFELNQKHVFRGGPALAALRASVVRSLAMALALPERQNPA